MLLGDIAGGVAAGKSVSLTDSPSKYKALYVVLRIAQDVVCTKIPVSIFTRYTNLTLTELNASLNVVIQIEYNSMSIYNCYASGAVAETANWKGIAQISLYGCNML